MIQKLLLLSLIFLFVSCGYQQEAMFDPFSNYDCEGDTLALDMDLSTAVIDGIMIPSLKQGEAFCFKYDTISTKQLYYKIYYQNDTYKFDESDSLAYENFYGSWEDVSIGFKKVPSDGHICDSFRIVGNPRDEKRYYGTDITSANVSLEDIENTMQMISSDSVWYNNIRTKAAQHGYSIEKQLFLDAQWVIADKRHAEGAVNHRWKRNPRVGCYSFLLVVCDSIGLSHIPAHLRHISEMSSAGQYQNPYSWYRKPHRHITLVHGKKVLKTRAVITPNQGMFVDLLSLQEPDNDITFAKQQGYLSDSMYRSALFQQFFPAVSQQYTLRNIPIIEDLDEYSIDKYHYYQKNIDSSQLRYEYPQVSKVPASTVRNNGQYITIVNPASSPNQLVKESTGIKTRLGFSYGRFRGKIKFPRMLNNQGMWNGLTYAFWLIYQDNHEWNNRRPSYHGGYIDKGDDSKTPTRLTQNKYSEIDIEIVKTASYWPGQDVVDGEETKKQVAFACTNWDLACNEPSKFSSGISKISHNNHTYHLMRWYDTYKALTSKSMINNEIFDSAYYYYEIEWRPTEIIWRLGPDPQHLTEVGYMDSKHTAIPNNQMLCVVTQEYHYSEWWPPIVFQQGLIPYSSKDIEGRIYEIVIE